MLLVEHGEALRDGLGLLAPHGRGDRDGAGLRQRLVGDAVDLLRKAGHGELAEQLDRELVGRNVVVGRWTFQVVEDFEDGYYATWKRLEKLVRDELMAGRRHVFEAEMKADRRTPGEPGHEATPDDVA